MTASGQSDIAKKRKPKPKPKPKPKQLPSHQEKKPENDNPGKIPKVTGRTSACNRVCLPGHEMATDNQQPGLAATQKPASASAVQDITVSVQVDVSNYTAMDIAWNLSPNGTISGMTFSFR
ncbi:hypothetical protein FN846DRAFT_911791 [Sphaerosporella brunnea]|uniref:Uncharacterized protein n=1 Tax=Sphaerosporella brunnea TaxID=1250544 RepID=A0A5J5EK30_9PEZI|nr:hypothetical protein FN846DRAFT_911791 [Sphaerosporella brunnea]